MSKKFTKKQVLAITEPFRIALLYVRQYRSIIVPIALDVFTECFRQGFVSDRVKFLRACGLTDWEMGLEDGKPYRFVIQTKITGSTAYFQAQTGEFPVGFSFLRSQATEFEGREDLEREALEMVRSTYPNYFWTAYRI